MKSQPNSLLHKEARLKNQDSIPWNQPGFRHLPNRGFQYHSMMTTCKEFILMLLPQIVLPWPWLEKVELRWKKEKIGIHNLFPHCWFRNTDLSRSSEGAEAFWLEQRFVFHLHHARLLISESLMEMSGELHLLHCTFSNTRIKNPI